MTGRRLLISLAVIGVTLAAHAQSAGELLRSGDALDAKHRNQEALAIYLKAEALQPDDAEILRKIAKQYSQQVVSESRSPENKELAREALAALQ